MFKKGHKLAKGGKREGAGRPKGGVNSGPDIRELAQKYSERALARLAYWMESDNPKASVAAASALLDRGHGKPAQALEVSGKIETETPQQEQERIERVARYLSQIRGARA